MNTEQTYENIYVLFDDLTVHGHFHLLLQMMMVLFQTLIQMLHKLNQHLQNLLVKIPQQ